MPSDANAPKTGSNSACFNIKSVKITTKIDAQVATTKVEQVFENDTPYRLEGFYFFPIPERASISDFAIYDRDNAWPLRRPTQNLQPI